MTKEELTYSGTQTGRFTSRAMDLHDCRVRMHNDFKLPVHDDCISIYRFENDDGDGPYTSEGMFGYSSRNPHTFPHTHPSPYEEGYYHRKNDEFCALRTEQFRDWFSVEDCQECEDNGFRLVEYRIHPEELTWDSRLQVMFVKAAAVRVGFKLWQELHNV